MVVLDEAQAIKKPDAKATKAVCQLDARQRLCLSGTPIENNLEELWSQFAFLMPGLLGDRRASPSASARRSRRTATRSAARSWSAASSPSSCAARKAEVATELPPKHTILRRITLAPDQRELYETIRATMHERVREQWPNAAWRKAASWCWTRC